MIRSRNKIRDGSPVVRAIWVVVLLITVFTCLYPFVYMFILSMMNTPSMKVNIATILNSHLSFANYKTLFTRYDYSRYILNSVIVTGSQIILVCLFSSMAGYAFAKKRFPGRGANFMLFLILMMIPSQVTLIPKFLLSKELGLINTYVGLFLPGTAGAGVILMHQFMKTLPGTLLEAADIDGCSEIRKYLSLVLPLSKPVLVTQAIMTFTSCWGELLWPLIMSTDRNMITLTVAITTLVERDVSKYGLIMAGNTIAMLPSLLMYMVAQKQFIEGITLSGTKL